jgi:protein HIRA/HIR1
MMDVKKVLGYYLWLYLFFRSSESMGSRTFGSDDYVVNMEPWTCVHRLTGHAADVMDLAWSPDNSYLASCGLDSVIFVWDATKFSKKSRG